MKCNYCKSDNCHHCIKKIRFDVMNLLIQLEEQMYEREKVNKEGISNHLCSLVQIRDDLHYYFENDCTFPEK